MTFVVVHRAVSAAEAQRMREQWAAHAEFRRIAFAASPVEVRLFDGRRTRGQERFPQVDADATGVP